MTPVMIPLNSNWVPRGWRFTASEAIHLRSRTRVPIQFRSQVRYVEPRHVTRDGTTTTHGHVLIALYRAKDSAVQGA